MRSMATSTNLGFPYMGRNRELKKYVEDFWKGQISEADLRSRCESLCKCHWELQVGAGLGHVPVGDFTLYDRVLDAAVCVGAIPKRYQSLQRGYETYFAMARGLQREATSTAGKVDLEAMEMKKWFDTNYHYIVPEFSEGQRFQLDAVPAIITSIRAAKAAGVAVPRPVLVGPVTLLYMGKNEKNTDSAFEPLSLLTSLTECYCELLKRIAAEGVEWVQIDEPVLVLDLPEDPEFARSFERCYTSMCEAAPEVKLLVATYFGKLRGNFRMLKGTKIGGIHIDLTQTGGSEWKDVCGQLREDQIISLGIVDGRNIWANDLGASMEILNDVVKVLQDARHRMFVGPSCSLLHAPFTADDEKHIQESNPELFCCLSFAVQKLKEIVLLTQGINNGDATIEDDIRKQRASQEGRARADGINVPSVRSRAMAVSPADCLRAAPFVERVVARRTRTPLAMFPTTTIGSFPQTAEIRAARAKCMKGQMPREEYEEFIRSQIKHAVDFQERIGLDVLVHGESERDDMVAHFARHLNGYAFTENGWVVSYGSRCVKPPVIYGDVHRPESMTVRWIKYAQSLTQKPMKGMLTGPVTMMKWSFVRDDMKAEDVCRQIALAIRDEVSELDAANIPCIQVDEPAIREGLPLRRAEWDAYLKWAVECFKLSTCAVRNDTQIHTHMCYSDFNDIFSAIQQMDADVITIENSRSDCKLLKVFDTHKYPNEIGPGVYDIHSPRVPTTEEITSKLQAYLKYIPRDLLWVNPDCGLKSRTWPEAEGALRNLVAAAVMMRKEQS